MPQVSGVVLAGGQSRRLGMNKALVKLDGERLIDRVVDRLRALSDDVLVVANEPEPYRYLGVRLIGDAWLGAGPLGGIYTGVREALYERTLIVGCDMPFLNLDLLRYMIELSAGYDVVIPRFEDLVEPLHAVYSRACLGPIEEQLRAGNLRLVAFNSKVRVRYVGPSELERFAAQASFLNVNTPEDLQRARELACDRTGSAPGCLQGMRGGWRGERKPSAGSERH